MAGKVLSDVFVLRFEYLTNIINPFTFSNHKNTENPKDTKYMIRMEMIKKFFFKKQKG